MSEKGINSIVIDEHYVRPQAAWEQMAARTTRQTVYLYGVTGTGKTTFMADTDFQSPGAEMS